MAIPVSMIIIGEILHIQLYKYRPSSTVLIAVNIVGTTLVKLFEIFDEYGTACCNSANTLATLISGASRPSPHP